VESLCALRWPRRQAPTRSPCPGLTPLSTLLAQRGKECATSLTVRYRTATLPHLVDPWQRHERCELCEAYLPPCRERVFPALDTISPPQVSAERGPRRDLRCSLCSVRPRNHLQLPRKFLFLAPETPWYALARSSMLVVPPPLLPCKSCPREGCETGKPP